MTSQEAPGGSLSLIETVLNANTEGQLLRQAEAVEAGEQEGDLRPSMIA